ncbi:MAG: c-di-GMP-binding flagellar brake protein YcgR [Halioglobus sp.]|jgi:c-di-GMP-binding flagellar brake protein YcgR
MLELMESTDDIVSILETFQECRNALSATSSASSRGPYTSYILNVADDGLYIDQLMPNSGNYLILPGQIVDFVSTHNGIDYMFRATHISREVDESGFPYHHITLPTLVEYSEKRSRYRIAIRRDDHPYFHISIEQGRPQPAIIENISLSGASLRVKEHAISVEKDSLVDCKFDLLGQGPIQCQAVIRHQTRLTKTRETVLGLEFQLQGESSLKALQKILMAQQRRNIHTYLPT